MSENEYCEALTLLNEYGIMGQPVSMEVIAQKDSKPYAYRVKYRVKNKCDSVVCVVE